MMLLMELSERQLVEAMLQTSMCVQFSSDVWSCEQPVMLSDSDKQHEHLMWLLSYQIFAHVLYIQVPINNIVYCILQHADT